jgi:hypothetical protein
VAHDLYGDWRGRNLGLSGDLAAPVLLDVGENDSAKCAPICQRLANHSASRASTQELVRFFAHSAQSSAFLM